MPILGTQFLNSGIVVPVSNISINEKDDILFQAICKVWIQNKMSSIKTLQKWSVVSSPGYEFNVRTYTISSVRLKPRICYKIAIFLIREICTLNYEIVRHPTTAYKIDVQLQHEMSDN